MKEIYEKLKILLPAHEIKRGKNILALMLVMAFLDMIGVASILPFVTVLSNPEIIETNTRLAALYQYTGHRDIDSFLFFLGTVVLVLFVVSIAFKAFMFYSILKFSNMQSHLMSCRMLEVYLRQPYSFFLGRNTADMSKTIFTEVNNVANGVISASMKIISGLVLASTMFLLLLIVEPLLSLSIAVFFGGNYFLIYKFTRKYLTRIGEERLKANRQRFILANEALGGIKELKLLGREDIYLTRFKQPSILYVRYISMAKLIGELPFYFIQLMAFGGVLVVILYLMERQGGIEQALPIIALYTFASYRMLPKFHEIFRNIATLRSSLPVLDSLYEDMTRKKGIISQRENVNKPLHLRKAIKLLNVTYRYPQAENNSVSDINLSIKLGTSIGFVGSTGAGKTTIVDIILGLLRPTSGSVLIDDNELTDNEITTWQCNLGYVPQSIYLVDDTIAANIAFGVHTDQIDLESVKKAAKAAHIDSFIQNELPDAYETIVGERGVRISGGQRQRIAIARALYHDPDVVIFDEATSALDNTTEKAVLEAIEDLHGTKTLILIAHRLTTVRSCDQIFFIDKGHLLATGSFSELMNTCDKFRYMAGSKNKF